MLHQHPFFNFDDFDSCAATYWAAGLRLAPGRAMERREQFRAFANRLEAPSFSFYFYDFSLGMTLIARADDTDYWLTASVQSGDRTATVSPITKISSPGRDDPVTVPEQQGMLGLRLSGAEFHRYAEQFYGEDLKPPLIFDSDLSARTPAEHLIGHQLAAAADLEARDPVAAVNPIWQKRFFEAIAANLLTFRPHSAFRLTLRPNPGPAPRDIRRAMDYVEAHLAEALTLSELAAVAGVPIRTLSAHFQHFVGLSPMAFVKYCRLLAIHSALRTGAFESVTEAALAHGVVALGRFAGEYRATFGERPSDTLRGAKG